MLKKAASFVLASLGTSTYRKKYASVPRSLRPPTGKARVPVEERLSRQARGGWVRQRAGWAGEEMAFLNILKMCIQTSEMLAEWREA
jgi:hypothetical protein